MIASSSLGKAGYSCFIVSPPISSSFFWLGMFFYILPLFIIEIYNIYVFQFLAKMLRQIPSSEHLLQRFTRYCAVHVILPGLRVQLSFSLFYVQCPMYRWYINRFLTVVITTKALLLLNRMQGYVTVSVAGSRVGFFLSLFMAAGAPLQGLGDFIIYRVGRATVTRARSSTTDSSIRGGHFSSTHSVDISRVGDSLHAYRDDEDGLGIRPHSTYALSHASTPPSRIEMTDRLHSFTDLKHNDSARVLERDDDDVSRGIVGKPGNGSSWWRSLIRRFIPAAATADMFVGPSITYSPMGRTELTGAPAGYTGNAGVGSMVQSNSLGLIPPRLQERPTMRRGSNGSDDSLGCENAHTPLTHTNNSLDTSFQSSNTVALPAVAMAGGLAAAAASVMGSPSGVMSPTSDPLMQRFSILDSDEEEDKEENADFDGGVVEVEHRNSSQNANVNTPATSEHACRSLVPNAGASIS